MEVVFYKEEDGRTPVLDWLAEMERRDPRIVAKCMDRVALLAERGNELRRPLADILRDGIYELRVQFGSVNYRLLYFFHGRTIAVVAHGLTKEAKVPDKDINLAIERRKRYLADPENRRTVMGEEDEQDQ